MNQATGFSPVIMTATVTPRTTFFKSSLVKLRMYTVSPGRIQLIAFTRHLDVERLRLGKARDALLGPREERSSTRVSFERSAHAKRSRGDDRAYGIGEMVQLARKVEAPAAASKIYEGELDEDQKRQQEFLTVDTHM